MKSGFILFDDPDIPESGWICVHGDDPYRLSSLSGLGNQVIYWSNMRWQSAYNYGLLNHAYLRNDSFFRLNANEIMKEVGCDVLSPQRRAQWMAALFHYVNRVSSSSFGFNGTPMEDIKKSIRESILPFDAPMNRDTVTITQDAKQEYALCDRQQRPNSSIHALWMPRLNHAKKILSMAYPKSPRMTIVPKKMLPKNNDNIFEWLSTLGTPALVRVNIKSVTDQVGAAIFGHGSFVRSSKTKRRDGTKSLFAPVRQWVTSYDLMAMQSIYDFDVIEAIAFDDITVPIEDNAMIRAFFERYGQDLHSASYSLGIVADSLWTAYATTLNKIQGINETENVAAPFVRSIDRGILLRIVHQLTETGFTVHGFGTGRVHLAVANDDNQERDDVLDFCIKHGIVPPAWRAGISPDKVFGGEDRAVSALQTAVYYGDLENIIYLDDYICKGDD